MHRITFNALAEKVIEWGCNNRKPNTIHRYEEPRVKLKPYFGGMPLSAITADLAERFKKERLQETTKPRIQKDGTLKPGKPIAPATVNRELEFLRLSIRKAVEWGDLAFNPLSTVKHLADDNERMWVLTDEEENRLLQACTKSAQRRKYLRDIVSEANLSRSPRKFVFRDPYRRRLARDQMCSAVLTCIQPSCIMHA